MLKNLSLVIIAIAIVGCNVGNAPAPMTPDEAEKAVNEMPLDEKIKYIESSPIPPEEKQKRIEEAKAQAGQSGSGTSAPAAK